MLKKILFSLFFIYFVIGFFVLPFVLKSQVVEIANQETNAKLSIESISFNPFIFKLELNGVELKDLAQKHLVSLDSLVVNLEPSSLFRAAVHVKDITLTKPKITLVYNKDKTFNLASIVKEKPVQDEEKKEASQEIPRIIIDNIEIEDGALEYEDYTNANKFEFSVKSVGFKLEDIDTNDFNSSGAKLRFYSALGDGGEVDFRSEVIGFKPLILKGSLDFKASKLYTQWRYIQDKLGIEVANGSLSFGATYFLNVDDLNETRIDNLYVNLDKLRIKPKNQYHDILNLESLSLKDVSIKPMQQNVHVENISLNNLLVDFTIDEKGNIDWLEYINNIELDKDKNIDSNTYSLSVNSINTNFDTNKVDGDDKNSSNGIVVSNLDFNMNEFLFRSKTNNETLLDFKKFEIDDVHVNTKTKDILVSDIDLNGLGVYLRKDKTGSLNIDGLLVQKSQADAKSEVKATQNASDEKPFSVKLSKVSLSSAEVNFNDESLQTKTLSKIDDININAYNIDSLKDTWLDYDISMKINSGGSIVSKGSVRHTPLMQKGSLDINKISLKEFTPYLQESMYVSLVDGYFSLNSKLAYSKKSRKPDLHVDGGLKIEEFELIDSRNEDRLLMFTKTELKSFNFDLFPNSLFIDEINLDAFYINAQIDKNKQMNLAKLSKASSDDNRTKVSKESNTKEDEGEAFPLKIMKLHVSNGAATFADYSLPLQFKTSIHDLNGNIYAISNAKGEVSYIDIDGEIDKYGSTKLKGSIEASNVKSYTDIGFSFRNLGLDSYSGYSAKFAGHKISNGKLFLDLGYKIHDSKLMGSNSVIIKNMELGDTIEDENITQLPLGFAIALLEDSDGVIDIDMPVEGNMDEPDFKYGALVVKTFANLIVKAVASPFNFLGAAMGINGDDLKFIDFDPSEFVILPPQREKLDNLAKILLKKKKLSLEILGSYDSELDKKAMQLDKLTNEVVKRSNDSIMTIDILEDIYEEYAGSDVADALKDEYKKRYEEENIFDLEYKKELLSRCISMQTVTEGELIDLANKRGFLLKDYLVKAKNIDSSRIISSSGAESGEGDEKMAKTELKIVVK